MVTAPVAFALLAAVAVIAIAAACAATVRARAAQAALRAATRAPRDSQPAGDVARDLTDLLTTITRHAESLVASLDPSAAAMRDAAEIRRAASTAARLTEPRRIDPPATVEPASPAGRAPVEGRVTATVLVVEDEPGMREFIRLVLERIGHEVVAVAGPRAALAALNRRPALSLMLVDVVMPEMDGYDLVAEARKVSPGIRVVFISAFAPDATRQPGGDGFLAKPFTIESLTGIVDKALS